MRLNCVGLFTGKGSICNTYLGNNPNPMDIVRIFNFDDEICARFAALVLFLISSLQYIFLKKCLSTIFSNFLSTRIMRAPLIDLASSQVEPSKSNGDHEASVSIVFLFFNKLMNLKCF